MAAWIAWSFLAALGHGLLCCAIWGRITAQKLPCRVVRIFERFAAAVALAYPAWLAGRFFYGMVEQPQMTSSASLFQFDVPTIAYGHLMVLAAATVLVDRLWRRSDTAEHVTGRRVIDASVELKQPLFGTSRARLWGHIPGNQVLELEVNEKVVYLPRLAPQLDGFSITHLSDLHFTGRIRREYFELAAAEAARLGSDLIAVTGDILDKAHCLDWVPSVFQHLKAPLGTFVILGNHDTQFDDCESVRRAIVDCGATLLSGRTAEIEARGQTILLASNELPWLPAAEVASDVDRYGLRLLLAHSPDQIEWARRRRFDLMLAGHTHGGQVQLPLLGPVLAPSRYGVRYASGTFVEPPTVMHVTRGVSALHCLRIRCRPEITRLVLKKS